jgi:hypothetical protein
LDGNDPYFNNLGELELENGVQVGADKDIVVEESDKDVTDKGVAEVKEVALDDKIKPHSLC